MNLYGVAENELPSTINWEKINLDMYLKIMRGGWENLRG